MKKYFDSIYTNKGTFIIMAIFCLVALICNVFGLGISADATPLLFFGMAVLTQGNTLQDILKWEAENNFSREVVTVKSGQNLVMGAVIGKITRSTPTTGTAGVGNTGAGTVTSVHATGKTKIGIYTLTALSATKFDLQDPDGEVLIANGTLGAYTHEQLHFTIADGSPSISAGDVWTVTVAAGSGYVQELDLDGVDGSEDAYGILTAACDATSANTAAVAIVREAQIVTADLVWPTGASAGQKAIALAELVGKGIVAVTET